MDWQRFALYNFLGAIVWVTVIASVSYAFGSQLDRLARMMKEANYIILIVVVVGALFFWLHGTPRRETLILVILYTWILFDLRANWWT